MTDGIGAIGPSQLPWPRSLLEIERLKYWVDAGPARMSKAEREENERADYAALESRVAASLTPEMEHALRENRAPR